MAACAGYVSGEQETDYYPYGGEYPPFCSTISDQNYKFTGKERDSETGLDYFGARYYASNMGRFSSPDPKLLTARHLVYPQKWNKYAYVQNNPLTSIDPDGLDDFKVFVNFSSKDVAAKNTPNWNAIKATAEKHGHTVTIYSGDSANAKNYQDALSSKGSHVISVGHSVESSPTTASGVMLGNGQSVGKGADPNNQPMQAPQNVQAASVDIFSCNSITLSSQYAGAGAFVGVDSGGNGTNSITLEQATAAFLTSATSQSANNPVNLDAATAAAQQTVTNSNNLTPLAPGAPPINIDKGDKVKKEKPE